MDPVDDIEFEQSCESIDNSKMFGRWWKFTGRIGRREFAITLLASFGLYFALMFVMFNVLDMSRYEPEEMPLCYFCCAAPPLLLLQLAAVKRAHDASLGLAAIAPILIGAAILLPAVFRYSDDTFNFFVVLLAMTGVAGVVQLLLAKSDDKTNKHGTKP